MQIGSLAKKAGFSVRAVRYYEELGIPAVRVGSAFMVRTSWKPAVRVSTVLLDSKDCGNCRNLPRKQDVAELFNILLQKPSAPA